MNCHKYWKKKEKTFGDEVAFLANEPKEIWIKNLYDSFKQTNTNTSHEFGCLIYICTCTIKK